MPHLDLSAVFTLLFVTLGPVKLLGPFAQATRALDAHYLKQLALLTFAVGTAAVLAGAFLGQSLVNAWEISPSALTLAGALIFLLVGLRIVLEPYLPDPPGAKLPAKPMAAAVELAFPHVVTPYGLAAAIALLAASSTVERTTEIAAMLVAIMIVNLLAMLFIRHIMGAVTILVLRVIGTMLAVLQVALAVQLIIVALRPLGVVG